MLSAHDISEALQARGDKQRDLFQAALAIKRQTFGDEVVLRGVIEVTNACRVNCDYCPMRRDNHNITERFFLGAPEIVARAEAIHAAGINVILLQGGETPKAAELVLDAVPGIVDRFEGAVEIILNLGSLGKSFYDRAVAAGASSYILKHETSDAERHRHLRHEDLSARLQEWQLARDAGLIMGTGIISGLPGQTYDELTAEILLLRDLAPEMISVSPFVPAPHTPMSEVPMGDVDDALNFLALTRIEHPRAQIPSVSALEKNAAGGQLAGISAGASVMTVNFTGEMSQKYHIYGAERFVVGLDHVRRTLATAGARPRRSIYA